MGDENNKNTNNNYMNQMMNVLDMMSHIQRQDQEERRSINKDTKRKIVFPDGTAIVFQNSDVEDIITIKK